MGVRRGLLESGSDARAVSRIFAASLREEFQDADARDWRRARLPRSVYRRPLDVHRPAAAGRGEPAGYLPRCRTLGFEASETASRVDRGEALECEGTGVTHRAIYQ